MYSRQPSSAGFSGNVSAPPGALLALSGDLNCSTVRGFEEGMKTALYRDPSAAVILDLRAVGRIDATGLASLIRTAQQLQSRQRALSVLVRPESQVERTLYVGRLHRLLNVAHSPEEITREPASA